jgi:hypothetical protein
MAGRYWRTRSLRRSLVLVLGRGEKVRNGEMDRFDCFHDTYYVKNSYE